jgi:phage protein D
VLRAEVSGVDVGPAQSVLTALAPSRRLAGIQVGRAWQQTTLGQVVRDLLDDGGVDAGEVSAPLSLPALHVDPHRSIWSALHDLARRTGHQVTTSPDGAVSFGPVPGTGGGTGPGDGDLRAGADLLSTSAGRRPSRPALARTSPAGPKYWYQLEASPDDGSAVLVLDPALRTREAADAATEAAAARASRATTTARLRVTGRPALRAGGIVRADGQAYRVLEVSHLVEPSRGYVCDLVLEGDA